MLEYLQEYAYKSEVSPDHFTHMTDWLLNWRRRDPEMSFSVVLIDFKDPTALGNALGAKYAMDLLKRVTHEINLSLRTTDLLCRTRISCFWVLLMKSEPEIVLGKLEPILSAARQDGMNASQLQIDSIVVPRDVAADVTATELFMYLQTHNTKLSAKVGA